MATINHPAPQKRKDRPSISQNQNLQPLSPLILYVATAEWRDYALDHTPKIAFFSIFKSSHETLILRKNTAHKAKEDALFILRDRKRILARSAKLDRILSQFERLPKLVSQS